MSEQQITVEISISDAPQDYISNLKERLRSFDIDEGEQTRGAVEIAHYVLAITAHSALLYNEIRKIRADLAEKKARATVSNVNGDKLDIQKADDNELNDFLQNSF